MITVIYFLAAVAQFALAGLVLFGLLMGWSEWFAIFPGLACLGSGVLLLPRVINKLV